MGDSKLLKPLFYGNFFNRDGHRMRAVYVKTVSNSSNSYPLWRCAGKPDRDYVTAENDKYYLHVEVNGYLVPFGETEHSLIERSGVMAVDEQYGGFEARQQYFHELWKSNQDAYSVALDEERKEVERLGSDPARQADYIKKILDKHVETYLTAKENGGKSFPNFIGALVLSDLAVCAELAPVYRAMRKEEEQARAVRAAEEEKAFCDEQNRVANKAIADAIWVIRDGGVLENGAVAFYRSKYDVSTYSIVLYLMRQYGIEVPLRTQGWINDKLVSITVEDGRCENLRYLRAKNGRCSEKFFDCMDSLIRAVTEQTEKESAVA